jgi:hypothetical protein
MGLLYLCAEWHALAKLRMHTDDTLELLTRTTSALGQQFHLFISSTCAFYDTLETAKEQRARLKRTMKPKGSLGVSVPLPMATSDPSNIDSVPTSSPLAPTMSSRTPTNADGEKDATDVPSMAVNEAAPGAGSTSGGAGHPGEGELHVHAMAEDPPRARATKLHKKFNLATYKYHALGDYVSTIRKYGTTDSYTTERVLVPLYVPSSLITWRS